MGHPTPARKAAPSTVQRTRLRALPDNGERKILAITNLKEANDAASYPYGGFTGYVSVFGNVDSYGDIVVKGAYAKTLPPFIKDGFIAWNHNWSDEPIGTIREAHEDDVGLYIDVEFHSTEKAQNIRKIVAERLARGKTMGLSIGYTVPKDGFLFRDDGVRLLKVINLFEGSLVNLPANKIAQVTEAKRLRLLGRIAAKETPFGEGGEADEEDDDVNDAGLDSEDDGPVDGDEGDPENVEAFDDTETFEGDEPDTAAQRITAETKLAEIKSFGGLCTYAYLHPDRKAEVLSALDKSNHGHKKAGKYDEQCPRCRFAADLMRAIGQPDPVLDRANDGTDPDDKGEHTATREQKSMNLTAEQRAAVLKAFDLTDEATDASIEAVLAGMRGQDDDGPLDAEGKAVWSTAYKNDLPDGAFATVLPGGKKDDDGKTVPRSLRKYPHHDKDGKVDDAHVNNAKARLAQNKDNLPDEHAKKASGHLEGHKPSDDGKSLADGAFGYIHKGADGQPVRMFQHHGADGEVDVALLRKSIQDLAETTDVPDSVKPLVRDHLQKHAEEKGIDEDQDDAGYVPDHLEDAAMTLAAEGDHTLARVDSLLARARAATELRAKEGRPLSSNNRTRLRNQRARLAEVLDELDKLLTETDRDKPAKGGDPTELQEKVREQANRALEAISEAHVLDTREPEGDKPAAKGTDAARELVETVATALDAIEDGVTQVTVALTPKVGADGKSVAPETEVKSPPDSLLEAVQAARAVVRTTRLVLLQGEAAGTLTEAVQQDIAKAADVVASLKEQIDAWKSPQGEPDAESKQAIRDLELDAMATLARVVGL